MQRMKKPGGRDLASSEFVLLDGARTLRVPKMPKNDYITEAPRQALFVCDPEVLGRAGEHLAAVGGDQAAIAEAREAIRRGLVAVTTPKGRDAALALVDESLAASERPTYDDLEFIRDLADFFGAGRFAESKYRRGRLAGLAICLYSIGSDDAHLEIYGPLCAEHLDLEPVGWHDQNLPPLGWRDDRSDVLHRATLAQIVDLIAEARERGLLEVAA